MNGEDVSEISENLAQSGWETSDPNKHNPKDFRYIVYGTLDMRYMPNLRPDLTPQDLMHDIYKPGGMERLISRDALSTSVIDQDHTGTFGDCGLILDVPKENIFAASPKDTGSVTYPKTYSDYIKENRGAKYQHIPSASEILAESGKSIYPYNEVNIHPTNPRTGEKVKVVGTFISIDPKTHKYLNSTMAEETKQFARERNLPIIEIVKRND